MRGRSGCKLMHAKFHEMQLMPVEGVYHKVGVDKIGPLQTSASGNRYIITIIEFMTKNVEAAGVPDKSKYHSRVLKQRDHMTPKHPS